MKTNKTKKLFAAVLAVALGLTGSSMTALASETEDTGDVQKLRLPRKDIQHFRNMLTKMEI